MRKGISSVIAITLLILVAILSVIVIQVWFQDLQSQKFIEIKEEQVDDEIFIESIYNENLYINTDSNLTINSIKVNNVNCPLVSGDYEGLSLINISTCLESVNENAVIVTISTPNKIFSKNIYIQTYLQSSSELTPEVTRLISLNEDILSFESNYTDLEIYNIYINGSSTLFPYGIDNYSLTISGINNYDTYNCVNEVFPVFGDDDGVHTISDLGFDFFFYNNNYSSGSSFYIDTNGRISPEDSNSVFGPSDSDIYDIENIAFYWNDLTVENGGMYVCSNQGTSPNKYAVVKLEGEFYDYSGSIENEVILHENGTIDMYFGGLVGNYGDSTVIGLSNGIDKSIIERNSDYTTLANTSRTYSPIFIGGTLNFGTGFFDINLSENTILDLTNENHTFLFETNKGNFTEIFDVETLFDSCSLNGTTTTHLNSNTFYTPDLITFPDSCNSMVRTCSNGMLSGSSDYNVSACNLNVSSFPYLTSCYNPDLIGTIGTKAPCENMLIVNNSMLFSAIDDGADRYISFEGINYTFGNSTYNIFTGQVTNMANLFFLSTSFNSSINYWDVGNVTDMESMFLNANSFNQPLNNWNVSSVTNMGVMFTGATAFNQPLNSWDVSLVTDMRRMFDGASAFNQPLSNWNVSLVIDSTAMFSYADSFNQSLNDWDVSSVTNMVSMFFNAASFNQPLNDWNVTSVTDMRGMFDGASSFNQPLNNWTVNNVTDMEGMFDGATSFNQNLSSWCIPYYSSEPTSFDTGAGFEGNTSLLPNWSEPCVTIAKEYVFENANFNLVDDTIMCGDATIGSFGNISGDIYYAVSNEDISLFIKNGVYINGSGYNILFNTSNICTSNVDSMVTLFSGASSFNNPLNHWDVSSVTDMGFMFFSASSFNQPLDNWNVSSVTNMENMFAYANTFDQPLNSWDVSSVISMSDMFSNTNSFNQSIENWDISSVETMRRMFANTISFNQPLEGLNVSLVEDMGLMFYNTNAFNQPLNNWTVSSVFYMNDMFAFSDSFNQSLDQWDTSSVETMGNMFESANAFNQNISMWDVGGVYYCFDFNGGSSVLSNTNRPSFSICSPE